MKKMLNKNIKIKKCYLKIFNYLNNLNINYTQNDNGIFLNINNLDNDTLNYID